MGGRHRIKVLWKRAIKRKRAQLWARVRSLLKFRLHPLSWGYQIGHKSWAYLSCIWRGYHNSAVCCVLITYSQLVSPPMDGLWYSKLFLSEGARRQSELLLSWMTPISHSWFDKHKFELVMATWNSQLKWLGLLEVDPEFKAVKEGGKTGCHIFRHRVTNDLRARNLDCRAITKPNVATSLLCKL